MFNRNNEPANNVKANGNNDYYVSRLSWYSIILYF